MLQPKVNGFVTVKAHYLSGNKVVVRWDKGNGSYEDDSYTATSDGIDSHTFSFHYSLATPITCLTLATVPPTMVCSSMASTTSRHGS